jgi:hypothetical protein
MNYRALLGTTALVGGALLVTLVISAVLDAWLLRPRTIVAATDGFEVTSPLTAATGPAASPVTRSRAK